MPQDPRDFRIDTFDRLWFSAIFVTVFGAFWLLFGAVAWALSRGIDLAVVGETAFAVIAAGAGLIGIFVLLSAADLYTGGVRAEGTVLENPREPAHRDRDRAAGRRQRGRSHRRARLLRAGRALHDARGRPRDRVSRPWRQRKGVCVRATA